MLTRDDYRGLLASLAPRGMALPLDETSTWQRLLGALAEELARVDARGDDLLREADPRSALEMLSDWERVCGLPDECTGDVATTLQERRAAVVARLTGLGSQSLAYFQALVDVLGYTVTIEEFRPFICGRSRCGDILGGPHAVRHTWRVAVDGPRVTWFRTGASQCGDHLATIQEAFDLECLLNRYKPAHTRLVFSYEE